MQLDHIELSQLDFRKLKVHKVVRKNFAGQDHSRWIFTDSRRHRNGGNRMFYKVWNRSYIRRDNILAALDNGFYDDETVPALRALIVSKGFCRGYIMEACRKPRDRDNAFFQTVAKRTLTTEHFAVQFGWAHVMSYRSQSTMIDLEGVYHIRDLALVRAHRSAFASTEYAKLVLSHYHEHFGGDSSPAIQPLIETHLTWVRQPVRKAVQTALKYQGKFAAKVFPGTAEIET